MPDLVPGAHAVKLLPSVNKETEIAASRQAKRPRDDVDGRDDPRIKSHRR
jgi:hypothetical protein